MSKLETVFPIPRQGAPRAKPELLKLEYRQGRLSYKQIRRSETVALYGVYCSGRLLGYEVIRPIIKQPCMLAGRVYPLRESYPPSERFGSGRGWYYSSDQQAAGDDGLKKAMTRYKEQEALHATST
jgi:hypothetical protein